VLTSPNVEKPVSFSIAAKDSQSRARAGVLRTPHGEIQTPAFIPVGTKATVKGLTPEQVKATGAQAVLGNTYHLYLEPGHERVAAMGGLGKAMGWDGPTFTDSGGFQVFSLGVAFGRSIKKVAKDDAPELLLAAGEIERGEGRNVSEHFKPASVSEDGVMFRSHLDGSAHFFTPEKSVEIQHALGADIIFAFDECPAPSETPRYLDESLARTHRWAKRSLEAHRSSAMAEKQGMFAVVQGARHEDLRRASARALAEMGFDGYGLGGAFAKIDAEKIVSWVNEELPEEAPKHLLGIGEPEDILSGIAGGCDTFDCVSPARLGRTAIAYTKDGKINLKNASMRDELAPIETGCDCYTCASGFTRAYLAHLFRAEEMLAATLLSIHNVRFLVRLCEESRAAIGDGTFGAYREAFLAQYRG
jgi:queuine tRNA-ribosyltransferase